MNFWVSFLILLVFLQSVLCLGNSRGLPSIQEVCEQSLKYARLEPKTIHNWEKKVRKAPLLPRLQFGFERRLKNNVNVNVEDSVAVNSSGITIGPASQKQIQNADNDMNFEVKAVWFLDQLLFSRDDLDISQEARELALEREKILKEVRQHYFKRQRSSKELELLKKSGTSRLEIELKQLEIAEATSVLDSLTGGWFSSQVNKTL